ncbi:hypothetical protein LCGC14_0371760 [marine sediment metagenome]|uniref:Uncharacterized protein n=1 Tax=marine sediment metagenome TaxID=412755 RepID=A0A0F9TAZ5_9ZZZZ
MSKVSYDGSFEVEAKNHYYRIVPLDMYILVVASVNRTVGDWTVYIGIVGGTSHNEEWRTVKEWGTKLDKHIAAAIFPELNKQFTWYN